MDIFAQKERIDSRAFQAYIDQPQNADRLFELIDGEIIEVSPKLRHGRPGSVLHGSLYVYLKTNPIGELVFEVDFQMPDDLHNVRRPDIAFISNERLGDADPDETLPFMPDLAIEIKSPSNSIKGARGLREKALYYLENGSRLVWLLFPLTKTAEVCTLNADGSIQIVPLGKEGILDGDVLPGFTLTLKEVFSR